MKIVTHSAFRNCDIMKNPQGNKHFSIGCPHPNQLLSVILKINV